MKNKYTFLASRLKVEDSDGKLRQSLTHSSFCKSEKGRHNSPYVFLGMYAFKGLAAEALFMRRYPISGTQMQHALGEMFKHDNLHRIFAYYDLGSYVRHSADFETDRHRHIFVFSLLGWLFVHASGEVKKAFIERHFLSALPHLFVSQPRQHDLPTQCKAVKAHQDEQKRQLFCKAILKYCYIFY